MLRFAIDSMRGLAGALLGIILALPCHAAPPAAEIREQENLGFSVQQAWTRGTVELIDAYAEEWRSKQTRTSSGYWKLSLLYNHLDDNLLAENPVDYPHGSDWRRINQWIDDKPLSPTPVILKALMLIRQAQDGFVPPRTQRVRRTAKAFKPDFLEAARSLLDECKHFASRDPHWYTAYLRILRLRAASDEDLLIAHAEALAAHPLYYQTHLEVFREFILRWHPNMQMIDTFANTVLAGTKAQEGHQVYARLYEDATIELNQGRFFTPSRVVWDRMRTGYEEINARFPTAWNAHHFAFNSCMADDLATLSRLFASFKGVTVREAWQSAEVYRHCRQRASP